MGDSIARDLVRLTFILESLATGRGEVLGDDRWHVSEVFADAPEFVEGTEFEGTELVRISKGSGECFGIALPAL